ncbi:DUF1653 domain-containing protein [uncultured Brevibacillus sp.]|nr:DUF1653 domain-containing protein [uncultured Brevibacillus sp.]
MGIATHSETGSEVIVYQNDLDHKMWVRPIHMFYESVEYKGHNVPRF